MDNVTKPLSLCPEQYPGSWAEGEGGGWNKLLFDS